MKVAILSQHCLNTTKNELNIIKLKHPRTSAGSLYLFTPETNKLQELIEFKESNRSWFINQTVQPDGALILGTPIDPAFLILPYLQQNCKNYCPLDDILHDDDFVHTKHLIGCCEPTTLSNISSQKDVKGNSVYKYDKEKTLKWLKKKVENVVHVLKEKQLDVSEGSRLSTFVDASIETDQSSYLRCACNLVSEYITEELSWDLFESLGLPVNRGTESPSKCKSEKSTAKGSPNPKKRKIVQEEPLEDYSSFGKKLQEESKAKNVKLSAAQKQLQKVNKKGMKNISSFFGGSAKK